MTVARQWNPRRARPQVLRTSRAPILEAGEIDDGWAPERVVLLVHWSTAKEVSRSTRVLVDQFRRLDYEVVLVSASQVPERLEWSGPYLRPTAVYRRDNVGYDFGSWSAGLHALPMLSRAPNLLLVNDSMLGPFAPIDSLIADFEASSAEIWGLVSSSQEGWHLQSHFVGYRNGCLSRGPLAGFWRSIRVEREKRDIIKNYELGLGRLTRAAGLSVQACYPGDLVVSAGDNPTIQGWRRLIALGFPFVKREILLRPASVMTDADHVEKVVQQTFGENVWEWL